MILGLVRAAVVIAARDDHGLSSADQAAIERAVGAGGESSEDALAALDRLSHDPDRWSRLVADGGGDLAALLDLALPALAEAEEALALSLRLTAPFPEGSVADAVAPSLGRAGWVVFAVVPDSDPARSLAARLHTLDDPRSLVRGDPTTLLSQALVLSQAARLVGAGSLPPASPRPLRRWTTDVQALTTIDDGDDDADVRASIDATDRARLPGALSARTLLEWSGDVPLARALATATATAEQRDPEVPDLVLGSDLAATAAALGVSPPLSAAAAATVAGDLGGPGESGGLATQIDVFADAGISDLEDAAPGAYEEVRLLEEAAHL